MPKIRFTERDLYGQLSEERHTLDLALTRLSVDATYEQEKYETSLIRIRACQIEEELESLRLPQYNRLEYLEAEDAYNAEVAAQRRSP